MKRAVIGLDGFVDEVVHVVDKRTGRDAYTRIETIGEYADRLAQGAGLSTNVEIVPVSRKIGGNGPIFAQGLKNLGVQITYLGSIGDGSPHPVFEDFAEGTGTWCLAEPAQTDAMEFLDGKIIRSKLASLNRISWDCMVQAVGLENLTALFEKADLISFNNWTMIMNMNEIWEGFLRQITPGLKSGTRHRTVFLDLADPQKRTAEDIREALNWIREFQTCGYRTILGLNQKEAWELLEVLQDSGAGAEKTDPGGTAQRIAEALDIHCVTIHPVDRAVCYEEGRYYEQKGPYCSRPVLTTGAGDAYNVGFVYGKLEGWPPGECLEFGTASSGFYVRNGRLAEKEELYGFLEEWRRAEHGEI
ncbi:MAG: carbohydrate kinase family protein [Lachnospiraceae bacterium]|nr:carbohydrate kinase family protein [Lachnospiraceae bacterium]